MLAKRKKKLYFQVVRNNIDTDQRGPIFQSRMKREKSRMYSMQLNNVLVATRARGKPTKEEEKEEEETDKKKVTDFEQVRRSFKRSI